MDTNYEEILRRFEEGAVRVRDAAQGVNQRIDQFVEWLGSVQGRVETCVERDGLFLRFRRMGKGWVLEVKNTASHHRPNEYLPVSDCPLIVKVKVLGMLPDLLVGCYKSQDQLIQELNFAIATCDEYFATLPGFKVPPSPGNKAK